MVEDKRVEVSDGTILIQIENIWFWQTTVEKAGTSYNIVHISASLSSSIQYLNGMCLPSLLHSLIPLWPSRFNPSSQPSVLYRPFLLPKPSIHSTHSFQNQTGRERPTTVILFSLKPLPSLRGNRQYCLWGWFHKDLNTCVLHKPHTKYVTDHTHCFAGFTYGNNLVLVCGTFSYKERVILIRKPNVSGWNMDFSNLEM